MVKAHVASNTPSAGAIRILLIDDHGLLAWGLERLFASVGEELILVGKSGSLDDAERLAQHLRADVVLLGLDLGEDCLVVIPKLLRQPQLRVIAMAGSNNVHLCDQAVLRGARGLLHRVESPEAVIKSIRKVHAGELWLDRATTGRVFGKLVQRDGLADAETVKIASLTKRERHIVATLVGVSGARHRQVAGLLHMSEHTLRNHLSNIYGKLELNGQFELYFYAKRHGLDGTKTTT